MSSEEKGRILSTQPETKKIPILEYHSISDHATPQFKPFTLSPTVFAEHVAYLHQHGYTPITVGQYMNARSQGGSVSSALPERPVVITFDDGYSDFFTAAFPVLKRYGFTATVFVLTAFVNGTGLWMRRIGEATRPMLTWDQLAAISASGIECGGHSHSHPQLDTLPLEVARDEIVRCKRLLEDRLGQEITSFAYPYGFHNATTKRLVKQAAYTSACAGKHRMCTVTTDPFALTRLEIDVNTRVNDLAALLTRRNPPAVKAMGRDALVPMYRVVRRFSAAVRRYPQGETLAR